MGFVGQAPKAVLNICKASNFQRTENIGSVGQAPKAVLKQPLSKVLLSYCLTLLLLGFFYNFHLCIDQKYECTIVHIDEGQF